jgi:hypothetical protein
MIEKAYLMTEGSKGSTPVAGKILSFETTARTATGKYR